MDLLDKTSNPIASLLYDIAGEWVKEGSYEERVDLLLASAAQILKDIKTYLDTTDLMALAPLFRLLNDFSNEDLLGFLPEDNGVYKPEVCGFYR